MKHSQSTIFSPKLDLAVFTAYFLGAVFPLIALAFVVERYVFPSLADRSATLGLIVLVFSIAILSLGSFLVLRHRIRQSLARMDRDNLRLSSLLRGSSALAAAPHLSEATESAAEYARELANARATYVMLREGTDGGASIARAAGEGAEKLFGLLDTTLSPLISLVLAEGRPVLRGPERNGAAPNGVPYSAAILPLQCDSQTMGALVIVRTDPPAKFDPGVVDALSALSALSAVAISSADLRDAQRNFFSHVTETLVSALDSHLGFNVGHGNRVAEFAHHMGRALHLEEDRLQRLHFGALLHDIGMLKLERSQHMDARTCEKHAVLGGRMMSRIRLWQDIAPIVQHHHEWYDGTGYPNALTGEEIPLEARIVAVCDAFDTMTSSQSYKIAMPPRLAIQELEECSGTQFDPTLIEVFRELFNRGKIVVAEAKPAPAESAAAPA